MARQASATGTGVAARLASFVLERFPFALATVQEVLESCGASKVAEHDTADIEFLRVAFIRDLKRALDGASAADLPDPTPGVSADRRMQQGMNELVAACDGFLMREALASTLTTDERREILRGMIL